MEILCINIRHSGGSVFISWDSYFKLTVQRLFQEHCSTLSLSFQLQLVQISMKNNHPGADRLWQTMELMYPQIENPINKQVSLKSVQYRISFSLLLTVVFFLCVCTTSTNSSETPQSHFETPHVLQLLNLLLPCCNHILWRHTADVAYWWVLMFQV